LLASLWVAATTRIQQSKPSQINGKRVLEHEKNYFFPVRSGCESGLMHWSHSRIDVTGM
jgi:hypothetical protein